MITYVKTTWINKVKSFNALRYIEILNLVNLWKFGLGPRPNDLPAYIATPKDLPHLKVLREKATM